MSTRSVIATFERYGLEAAGFEGFASVTDLRAERCRSLPDSPGLYVVLAPPNFKVRFRKESGGGWFKGRNPTVPVEILKGRRLHPGEAVYVGMAGTSLRTRVQLPFANLSR